MTMQPIEGSSMIHEVGYDEPTLTLRVRFHKKDGTPTKTWDYTGVPPATHEEMLAAPSVGSYFLKHVKGVFAGTEVV